MKPTLLLYACLCISIFLNAQEPINFKHVSQTEKTNVEAHSFSDRKNRLQENWETRLNAVQNPAEPMLKSVTAVNKTVNITAGGLASALTSTEKTTVTNLTITGTIDARDFKTMRDDMTVLSVIDLSKVTIAAYTGNNGTADTTNYPANYIPVYAFYNDPTSTAKSTLTSVLLPTSLVGVDKYAFLRCKNLAGTLSLPASVTYIGRSAFNSTGYTGSLILPDNITFIGRCAFYNCPGFTGNLIIPSKLETIGDLAFAYDTGFKGTLTIPNSVTTILESAFEDCEGFTGDLNIPASVKRIDPWAFYYCLGFTKLSLPTSLTTINEGVFSYCSGLSGDLAIPSGIETLGRWAFEACSGFNGKLILNENLKSIGKSAFLNCTNLNGDLVIPNSVKEIGPYCFDSCVSISSLKLNTTLKKIDFSTFADCHGLNGEINIPATIDSIESFGFYRCKNIESVIIPESVTYLGGFSFCSLEKVNSIYSYSKIPIEISGLEAVFSNINPTCTLYVPAGCKTIYQLASVWSDFSSIVEIGNVKVPNTFYTIGDEAGSTVNINITTALNWTASSNQTWLKVSPESGSGNGKLTLTASANQTSSIRTATVTISATGETPIEITIKQTVAPWDKSDITLDFKSVTSGSVIDSIFVLNQNTGQSIFLKGEEAITLISGTTDIGSFPVDKNQGKLFPNPCNGSANMSFTTEKSENVIIRLSNYSGQILSSCTQQVQAGTHTFSLQLPSSGIYVVSVHKNSGQQAFKVISTGNTFQGMSLLYTKSDALPATVQLKGTTTGKTLIYSEGDNMLYTVYAGNNTTVIADRPAKSTTYQVTFNPCADKSGRNYKTVSIGKQIWMAENLAYLPKVGPSTEYSYTDNYYYVCGYSGTNLNEAKNTDDFKNYGVLYNWTAANNSCPVGWHLPSDNEWTDLEIYLQNNGFNYDGSFSVSRGRLLNNKIAKSIASVSGWEGEETPSEGSPAINPEKNNRSGFSALPGGMFSEILVKYGGFGGGGFGCWWSGTECYSDSGWDRELFYTNYSIQRNSYTKSNGLSVRCIKD